MKKNHFLRKIVTNKQVLGARFLTRLCIKSCITACSLVGFNEPKLAS